MQAKIVEITRDENGNLKEIYRPDVRTELRYPILSGDYTKQYVPDGNHVMKYGKRNQLECSFVFKSQERLDFYIK